MTESDRWSAEERANVALVRRLMAALESRDAAELAAVLAPDAVFTMGPIGELPAPAPTDFVKMLADTTAVQIDIRKIFASGPIVMTDRFDRLVWPERTIAGRWIGICAIKNGRIAEFTDYTIERTVTAGGEAAAGRVDQR